MKMPVFGVRIDPGCISSYAVNSKQHSIQTIVCNCLDYVACGHSVSKSQLCGVIRGRLHYKERASGKLFWPVCGAIADEDYALLNRLRNIHRFLSRAIYFTTVAVPPAHCRTVPGAVASLRA